MLHWLDRNAGGLLCRCLAPAVRFLRQRTRRALPAPACVKTIVVVKFCCLGDAVLMAPGLRAIRAAYPDAGITIVTTAKTSGVFSRFDAADRIVELALSINPWRLWRTVRRAVPHDPDLLFCFEPWYPTATLVCNIIGGGCRIGFHSARAPYNQSYFDISLLYTEERHVVDTYRSLAEAGIPAHTPTQGLRISIWPEEYAKVNQFFKENKLNGDVAVLFAAGSPTWLRKRWPTERFAILADSIVTDLGMKVLLLTGRGQEAVNREVLEQMRHTAVLSPGEFSVPELAAVIKRCRLLVSSDSSPIHIASAVGTPVVAMFGPVPSITYHPYLPSEAFRVIRKDLRCSPCVVFAQASPCPSDYKCIGSITVEEVLAAVKSIVASQRCSAGRSECTS